jgi:DNA-binding beta-propeller fold protein YncE
MKELFAICLLCLSLVTEASASVTVTGAANDITALKNLINALLSPVLPPPATVDIDAQGKMTMAGNPNNEFGKQLQTIINDANNAVTIAVENNGMRATVGRFEGGGKQTIDIADIMKFAAPGNMLETMGAALIHEFAEVYDSVKNNEPNFDKNHEGSAKMTENLVLVEEAGIMRDISPDPTKRLVDPFTADANNANSGKVKIAYHKGGMQIHSDVILTRANEKSTFKVVRLEMEPAPPKKGFLNVTEEEPGLATFTNDTFQQRGFLTLDRPGYLATNPSGNIYISEQRLNLVLVFDRFLNQQMTISNPSLINPQGIAVSPAQGRIYVGTGNSILAFDNTGSLVSTIGNALLSSVRGLALDAEGFLYASSFNNNLVLKIDPTTAALLAIFSDGRLLGPEGIAVDQSGDIWVASFLNSKILQFDPLSGTAIEFASGGVLQGPRGIALGPQSFAVVEGVTLGIQNVNQETLFAASFGSNQVLEFDLSTGALLADIPAKSPVGVGSYNDLKSICDIDENGTIDINDISAIIAGRGSMAMRYDARDADGDGIITVNDARVCVLFCTKANCAQ